jgi:hypothetical protein
VNRKRKILFLLAFIALGIMSILFFARPTQPDVIITYVGPDTHHTNKLFFTITNTSHETLCCFIYSTFESHQSINPHSKDVREDSFFFPAHSQSNITLRAHSHEYWRAAVYSRRNHPFTTIERARLRLSMLASDRGLSTLDRALAPSMNADWATGPLMFGDRPVAEASKQSTP